MVNISTEYIPQSHAPEPQGYAAPAAQQQPPDDDDDQDGNSGGLPDFFQRFFGQGGEAAVPVRRA